MNTIFEDFSLISKDGRVKVVLEYIGEGNSGDYQPDDPDDKPLLRFSVYRRYYPGKPINPYFADDITPVEFKDALGGWRPVTDGSYCTLLTTSLPRRLVHKAARIILEAVQEDISCEYRCKRRMEELSWLDDDEIRSS